MLQEGTPEEKNLRYWLIGLARKTATNLELKVANYPTVFDQMIDDIEKYPSDIKQEIQHCYFGLGQQH